MIAYAGIGSRTIDKSETSIITSVSRALSRKGAVCYSGNAEGSDIAFQTGSGGRCVLWLPWAKFNALDYSGDALDRVVAGDSKLGLEAIDTFHLNPLALSDGGRRLMARNYHQIHGDAQWPIVRFVICCANQNKKGDVSGGTGFACKIAASLGIPVINIRMVGWGDKLIKIWNSLERT